jgi:hypothetical protein
MTFSEKGSVSLCVGVKMQEVVDDLSFAQDFLVVDFLADLAEIDAAVPTRVVFLPP